MVIVEIMFVNLSKKTLFCVLWIVFLMEMVFANLLMKICNFCGNLLCEQGIGENPNNCSVACHGCGNTICEIDFGENHITCPGDCLCGDGDCIPPETIDNCALDCRNICGNGICEVTEGESYYFCPADCKCGNGICDPKESFFTCPVDCTCRELYL